MAFPVLQLCASGFSTGGVRNELTKFMPCMTRSKSVGAASRAGESALACPVWRSMMMRCGCAGVDALRLVNSAEAARPAPSDTAQVSHGLFRTASATTSTWASADSSCLSCASAASRRVISRSMDVFKLNMECSFQPCVVGARKSSTTLAQTALTSAIRTHCRAQAAKAKADLPRLKGQCPLHDPITPNHICQMPLRAALREQAQGMPAHTGPTLGNRC